MQIYRCKAGCHGIFLQWQLSNKSVHQVDPDFIVTLIPTIQHDSTDFRYEGRRAIFTMREWLLCFNEICQDAKMVEPNPHRCWEPRIKQFAGDRMMNVIIQVRVLATEQHAI